MYGEVYAWDSIEDVILMEELPAIVMRTNGSALGSNLKGYFRTEEYGSVIHAGHPDMIHPSRV
ncbi:MAG: hypothetical protein ACOX1J_03735 [Dethiobacteria bacterium]|jgi:hypothetical protein